MCGFRIHSFKSYLILRYWNLNNMIVKMVFTCIPMVDYSFCIEDGLKVVKLFEPYKL